MTALSIVDINTVINAEPRVRDLRLGEVLGMARPTNIRTSVAANRAELSGLGQLHEQRAVITRAARGAIEVTEYWLNEAQALLLCMFARTERAAEVRRQVIEVFMAWRRQSEGLPVTAPAARTVPVRAHSRRVGGEPLPDDATIASIRQMRRGGMFTVRQIAIIHMVSEKAVRVVSDECTIDREPADCEVRKIGSMEDALLSMRAIYEEMGRRLDDFEQAFQTGASNQHKIGSWI